MVVALETLTVARHRAVCVHLRDKTEARRDCDEPLII